MTCCRLPVKQLKTQRCESEKKNQFVREIILFDSTCLNCHNGKQDMKINPHVSGVELQKKKTMYAIRWFSEINYF